MKRFIDLRDQAADGRFAWYCTTYSRFETFADQCCWNTWDEFENAYRNHCDDLGYQRYEGLTPAWAFEPFDGDALQRLTPEREFIEWLRDVMAEVPRNCYGGFGILERLDKL